MIEGGEGGERVRFYDRQTPSSQVGVAEESGFMTGKLLRLKSAPKLGCGKTAFLGEKSALIMECSGWDFSDERRIVSKPVKEAITHLADCSVSMRVMIAASAGWLLISSLGLESFWSNSLSSSTLSSLASTASGKRDEQREVKREETEEA